MFAIKGKGPRRGQAPPYSTILYGAFRPRRGQSGEERKSVKKNAALLCFLAFLLLDHHFGVLRGEQPLSRAPRLGSSGTFLLLFWSQKSRHSGGCPLKKALPQGRQGRSGCILKPTKQTAAFSYDSPTNCRVPPANRSGRSFPLNRRPDNPPFWWRRLRSGGAGRRNPSRR